MVAKELLISPLKQEKRTPHNRGKPSPNKGKTYEEIYGPEEAKRLKELRRKNKQRYWDEKKK